MCGIAGSSNNEFILSRLEMAHRGPDNFGTFKDNEIIFYHWRLSIIDIGKSGNQPISNENGKIVVMLNGEIYNYLELKRLYLKNHNFVSLSDTEVLVHLYEEFGKDFVKYLNGDFSIAIWDSNTKKLLLYRDRLGIRPLYYFYDQKDIYFSSEISPLLKAPKFIKRLDASSVNSYLGLRYVYDNEKTFFQDIKKISPGNYLEYDAENNTINTECYWKIDFSRVGEKKEEEYIYEFEKMFSDSVRLRMIADVPVGVYLSSGLDSNSIAYEMSKNSEKQIHSFSVSVNKNLDETNDAGRYSKLYGTTHNNIALKKDDYYLYDEIIKYLDELIGDPIVLPTYMLAKRAKENVKVVLSGEGADEILGGYIHHLTFNYLEKYWVGLPESLRNIFVKMIKVSPNVILSKMFPYPDKLTSSEKLKIINFLERFSAENKNIGNLIEIFTNKERKQLLAKEFHSNDNGHSYFPSSENLSELIENDANHWLPNYTLLKQDRMSMANSIEARSPFLDHRLVEFCAGLPNSMRINNFQTKIILRMAMRNKLATEIVSKKKKAFYLPLDNCFDNGFNIFIRQRLSKKEIERTGVIQWKFVEKLLESPRNLINSKKLFVVFFLGLWLKRFMN